MSMNDESSRFVWMYAGAYTHKSDAGITVFRLNEETGEAERVHTVQDIANASYLAASARHPRLYAVSEVQETNGQLGGEIVSYETDPATGSLKELDRQLTRGKDPCYVSLEESRQPALLLLTNYSSGNISAFALSGAGDLSEPAQQVIAHEGGSQATQRQLEAHTHSVVLHPAGTYAVVSDLGKDKLFVYRLDADRKQLILQSETDTAKGAGPRHFVFHPGKPYAYGINELDNTITAYAFDESAGRLTVLGSVPTLPPEFKGENTSADLHLDPSGQFIYGSNRGHDSIVTYRIDAESGALTYVEHTSTHGKTPRNFAIAPGGKLLLAANQQTDTIEVFHRDPDSGKLTHDPGRSISVSEPVCILFASM